MAERFEQRFGFYARCHGIRAIYAGQKNLLPAGYCLPAKHGVGWWVPRPPPSRHYPAYGNYRFCSIVDEEHEPILSRKMASIYPSRVIMAVARARLPEKTAAGLVIKPLLARKHHNAPARENTPKFFSLRQPSGGDELPATPNESNMPARGAG